MKKFSINNLYVIYSLITPILYIVLFIINFKFGTVCGDICNKPLSISDNILRVTSFLFISLTILQIVLFIKANHDSLNNLILASNIFHSICMSMAPVGGILALAFGGILFYFPIFIASIILWFKLLFKFWNN